MTEEEVERRPVVQIFQLCAGVRPENLRFVAQLAPVGPDQCGCQQVLLPVVGADVAVLGAGIDGDRKVDGRVHGVVVQISASTPSSSAGPETLVSNVIRTVTAGS